MGYISNTILAVGEKKNCYFYSAIYALAFECEEMASQIIQANSKQSVAHAEKANSGRPKRVCTRKSYCEEETDDEFTADEIKPYKTKGKSPESGLR